MGRKKSTVSSAKYQWNLNELYETQSEFEKSLKKTKDQLKKLVQFKGKIKNASGETYLKFYDLYKKYSHEASKIGLYSHWYTANMKDEMLMNNYGIVQSLFQHMTLELSWVRGEIRELGEAKITKYIKTSKKHEHLVDSIKDYFRSDMFHLDSDKEQFIANYATVLSSPSETYTELSDGDYKFPTIELEDKKTGKTKTKTLNSSLYMEILTTTSPREDQLLRLTSSQKKNEHFHNFSNTFAAIYKAHINSEVTSAKLEGFDSPLHYGLWSDNAPEKSFTMFIDSIYENKHLVYDWVKLHRTVMKTKGIKKYYRSDAILNLTTPKKKDISYEVDESIAIIKKATKFLGKEYEEAINEAFKPGRIDYYERDGKTSGGFMMSFPNTPAYILMNWSGEVKSLLTLAHEAGHAAHSHIASKHQPAEYADYPTMTAEVASTFIELVTLHSLIKECKNRDTKVYLLQNLISTMNGLYFFAGIEAKFELETKKLAWNNEPITKEVLGNLNESLLLVTDLYDKANKNFPAVGSKYNWSAVLHHFTTSFYLHKYALALVVTCNLFEKYLETKNADGYLSLIKMGGRKDPLVMIKEATGVDLLKMDSHKAVHRLWNKTIQEIKTELGSLVS